MSDPQPKDTSKTKLILCPKCQSLSTIDIMLQEQGKIHLKCPNNNCNYEEVTPFVDYLKMYESVNQEKSIKCSSVNHSENQAVEFCRKCNKFFCTECSENHKQMHPEDRTITQSEFYKYNVDNYCYNHNNNKYIYYCTQCNSHYCKECCSIDKHINHDKFISLDKLNKNYIHKDKIEDIILKGEEYLNETIDSFVTQDINYLTKYIDELKESYEKYKEKNKNMIIIMKSILENYSSENLNKYQINNILQISQLKNKKFTGKNTVNNLIKYLNSEFLFEYNKDYSEKVKSFYDNTVILNNEKIKNIAFNSDPTFLDCTEIANNAPFSNIPGRLSVFVSQKNKYKIAYGTSTGDIVFYDLEKGTVSGKVEGAHSQTLFICKFYYDPVNKRDVLVTSGKDKTVKLWEVNEDDTCNNLLTIDTTKIFNGDLLTGVNAIFKEKETYIIFTELNEAIKVYDGKGEYVKDIGEKNQKVLNMDNFCENGKDYLVLGMQDKCACSYLFDTGKVYKKYHKNLFFNKEVTTIGLGIYRINGATSLVTCDYNMEVNIFNFHKGSLLKSINGEINGIKTGLTSVCLWNSKYLLCGANDNKIKVFDIASEKCIDGLEGHTNNANEQSGVGSIEKFIHPLLGECLVSSGRDGCLKLWVIDKEKKEKLKKLEEERLKKEKPEENKGENTEEKEEEKLDEVGDKIGEDKKDDAPKEEKKEEPKEDKKEEPKA